MPCCCNSSKLSISSLIFRQIIEKMILLSSNVYITNTSVEYSTGTNLALESLLFRTSCW